jgi:cytochrome c6
MINKLVALIIILILLLSPMFPAVADTNINAAKLFEINCAGCHPKGGNIIRRGKTLKQKALKRYKMDSLEAITEIVTYGKGNMSAYGDRLTPSEIEAIAAYVLEKAENNWQSI